MELFAKCVGGSSAVLKAVPAAILAWACTLGMANAAVYAPDNFANAGGTNLETMVMVKDKNNRVVIGGLFNQVEGQSGGGFQGVARFNTDDSLDTTYKVVTSHFVKALAVQPSDGKVLIGGAFVSVQGTGDAAATPLWGIARLNENGSVDTSFQYTPGVIKANGNVRGIAVQPADGKIVIVGYFTAVDGTARRGIARLNTDGTLDTTFNVGTGANDGVEDVKLQADGKIVIAGSFTQVNGTNIRGVARLNADGSVDNTFVPNGGNSAILNGSYGGLFPVYQIAIQSDQKIVVNGGPLNFAGEVHRGVVRLNTNGTPDSSFKSFINDWGASVALQTVSGEQKIVAGGSFTVVGERDVVTDTAINTDVVRQGIARFNADGTVDADFDTSNGSNAWVWAVLPNDDGTVYMGGKFTSVAGMARRGIARLAPQDPSQQTIAFLPPAPAVYNAANGTTVPWGTPVPTTSSKGITVVYTTSTPAICSVTSAGVVTTATPAQTGTCTILANAAADPANNVNAAPTVTQSIQIDAPPDQSITFPAQTTPRAMGSSFAIDPLATASSGLTVTYSSLTVDVCTVSGTTVTPVGPGLCTIAANQAGNQGTGAPVEYEPAAQVSQSVAIQGSQTITFTAPGAQSVVVGRTFALGATASSGLAVSYSSSTPTICTVAGSAVTVLATGTCTITASQAGNDFYTAAAPVSQAIAVTALPVPAATPVPTLGEWALVMLAGLMGFLGLRRSKHAVR